MRTMGERNWNSTQAKLRGEPGGIPRNKSYHLHSLLHSTVSCIHAWGTVTVLCPSQLKDNLKGVISAVLSSSRKNWGHQEQAGSIPLFPLFLESCTDPHRMPWRCEVWQQEIPNGESGFSSRNTARNTEVTLKILEISKIPHSGL